MQPRRLALRLFVALPSLAHAHAHAHAQDEVSALIEQLRDDGTRYNAILAADQLRELEPPPLIALTAALDSDDWQQRQIAADILWWHISPPRWEAARRLRDHAESALEYEIPAQLYEVTLEGLRSDALPYNPQGTESSATYTDCFNAARGFRVLVDAEAEAEPYLLNGLESEDYQQKFLCALILAWRESGSGLDRVVPILSHHLRDNQTPEDAHWSVYGLGQIGSAAEPYLRIERERSDDVQQQQLIDLLLLNITEPAHTRAEHEARQEMQGISRTVFDPTREPPKDDWMGWLRDLEPE